MVFGGRPPITSALMARPSRGPSLSVAVIAGPLSAGPGVMCVDAMPDSRSASSSSALDGRGHRVGGLRAQAAALVDPPLGVHARLLARASVNHAQRGPRLVLRYPFGAATPAGAFLAGHRCLASAAQAWEVSIAHA